MKLLNGILIVSIFALLSCKGEEQKQSAEDQQTYIELVKQLADLKVLAQPPGEGETGAMASSYDRSSEYDESTGEYKNWAENSDGTGIVRRENGKQILADIKGPGCIWRIWSARPEEGNVAIILDGKEAINMPFKNFFDRSVSPFDYPELVYEAAKGMNNYVPIPFNKSCKIVADSGWGAYYQFNYMQYPEGTEMPTFSMKLGDESKKALQEANDKLAAMGTYPYTETESDQVFSEKISIAPGENATLLDLGEEGAIKAIRVKMDFPDTTTAENVLRKMSISMHWDGSEEAAVWSPLGDFFGTAPGANLYKTYMTGMTEEYYYAYWYMPFEKALVQIKNECEKAQELEYEIIVGKPDKPADELLRFHAKWHRDLEGPGEDRWPDWKLLYTEGKGRFAGVMLNVWTPRGGACYTKADPAPWWWGEGDEKFYVDGEKFPSTFGTGTEDYFGYAWCSPAYFEKAYHAQSKTQNNEGWQTICRWHLNDNVPFQVSFEGWMEKYWPNDWPAQYSALVCWYLSPNGKDELGPVPVDERVGYNTPWDFEPEKVVGALELEDMKPIIQDNVMVKFMRGSEYEIYTFSGDKFLNLFLNTAKENPKATFEFEVEKAGTYNVVAGIIKWETSPVVQFYINGEPVNKIDCYASPDKGGREDISLGTVELKAGKNTLGMEKVGQNPGAGEAYEIAIDYILLK